jgi:crotonobetainyl-CoA:carnitine CoA-transferase CaiB-like acyl-CoA transferase
MARAEAGWFYQETPESAPLPAGISIDYPAGLMLAQGILLALFARTHTGRGQYVSTDLLSVALHAHSWEQAAELNRDRLERNQGVGATEQIINKVFKTKDGWIEVSPVFSDNSLRDISLALGLEDISRDARFAVAEDRIANKELINAVLQDRFLERGTEEWMDELEAKGILCAKIRPFADAIEDPQAEANQMIIEMEHPVAGRLRLLGTPLRLQATPPVHDIPPSAVGEHNADILKELGFSDAQISGLEKDGIIGN